MDSANNVAMISDQQTGTRLMASKMPLLPTEYVVPRWYAAYTSANHEKRVMQQLNERRIENFLPLYETARRWKDRRILLHLPLFPGYVFVRISLSERLRVVQIPGVARLVGFNGTPAALSEKDITGLQKGLASGVTAIPHPFLTIGRRVRVKTGPLAGTTGVLLRRKGNSRVVVSIELLRQSVAVDVVDADLEPEQCLTSTRVKSRTFRANVRGNR